eukprot:TRINITY_DN4452_c0_g1_i2.p1 TRINITY_DN4452_c0_g1~~TRINITY_DN4452_c0_g1_i2.p1  ORF type:complete len:301 (+),score=83.43 TRINITY_DN4452_c0_g1_i2:194-1096(+)
MAIRVAGALRVESKEPADASMQELERLNDRRALLKADHTRYLKQHPELTSILNDFLTEVLARKPDDVQAFARAHFSLRPIPGTVKGLRPLLIAGPSGVGKGTIIKRIFERFPDQLGFSVSHTTRKPRPGEVGGVHYHFSTVDGMKAAIGEGKFIEHAVVHGNYYGTSAEAVAQVSHAGKVCCLDIDIAGVKLVKQTALDPHYVFVAPPSFATLEARLRGRQTESEADILKRLSAAAAEMEYGAQAGAFDVVLVNDDLERAVDALCAQLRQWYPSLRETAAEAAAGEGECTEEGGGGGGDT